MKLLIITFSALISIFTVILFTMNGRSELAFLLGKLEERKSGFFKVNSNKKFIEDMKFLIEQRGSIKFFGINFRSPESLLLFRIIFALSSAVILILSGFMIGKNFIILSIALGLILCFLPIEVIKNRQSVYSKKILRELPDIIDITSSLIRAGLTLEESITYISNNYKGEISKLFKFYKIKLLEGYSKKEAYLTVARLSFCNEFKSLIKIFLQSEEIGNPIKDVLKDLSRVIRDNQRDLLKMKAEKLENNLIIIIFVFIFIPMITIFLIPVIPQLKILF